MCGRIVVLDRGRVLRQGSVTGITTGLPGRDHYILTVRGLDAPPSDPRWRCALERHEDGILRLSAEVDRDGRAFSDLLRALLETRAVILSCARREPSLQEISTSWTRTRRGPRDEDAADAPGLHPARLPHRGVVPDFVHHAGLRIFFSVLIWYYVSRVAAAPSTTPGLEGVDYFAYVLLGLALLHYLSSALMSFGGKVRGEQMTGTLEAMLLTPTSIGTIVLGSSLWDFLLTSIKVVTYLVIGRLFFGVVIHLGNLLPALLIIALTVLAFSGLGILSAAFVLYLKRGDPITYLVASGSALVGGVFYPPEDMPRWLGGWSHLLPITYALRALRRALLRGSRFSELWPDIQALLLFVAVLLPFGILAFRFAVRKARQEGSLVQY